MTANRFIKAGRSCTAVAAVTAALFAAQDAEATVLQPEKVVVVVLQDRASEVLGLRYSDSNELVMPWLNSVAETALVYSNSHGVTQFTTPNSLALFSGSTQWEDGGNSWTTTIDWEPATLATRLTGAGLTFSGYVESLPYNGSQVSSAGPEDFPDLYTRNLNPMAMITTKTGSVADENPAFNRTFEEFQAISSVGNYAALPTISYVIPNNMHNTHGTNNWPTIHPSAGSDDELGNNLLRQWADEWLQAELGGYLQWARDNNSLLIITQDEEQRVPPAVAKDTITTLIAGDPDLFDMGVNGNYFNHYNLLRTLTEMYDLDPLGATGNYSTFDVSAGGKLTVPEPAMGLLVVGAGVVLSRRSRASREGSSL